MGRRTSSPRTARWDRETALAEVSRNGRALGKTEAKEFRSDREVVLAAVRQNGAALREASEDLWSDREIVMTAVTNNGLALSWASKELKLDDEIVIRAVTDAPEAFGYVADKYCGHERIMPLLKECFILRVSLLSGRNWVTVLDQEDAQDMDGADILLEAAEKLELDSNQRTTHYPAIFSCAGGLEIA